MYHFIIITTDKYWVRPLGFIMYLSYIVFVITIAAAKADAESHGNATYGIIAVVQYLIWLLVNLFELPYVFLGRRQLLAFGGLYLNLIYTALMSGTIYVFFYSFKKLSFISNLQSEISILILKLLLCIEYLSFSVLNTTSY